MRGGAWRYRVELSPPPPTRRIFVFGATVFASAVLPWPQVRESHTGCCDERGVDCQWRNVNAQRITLLGNLRGLACELGTQGLCQGLADASLKGDVRERAVSRLTAKTVVQTDTRSLRPCRRVRVRRRTVRCRPLFQSFAPALPKIFRNTGGPSPWEGLAAVPYECVRSVPGLLPAPRGSSRSRRRCILKRH